MKWEYKVIELKNFRSLKDPNQLLQELNNYGSEGWELIGILQQEEIGKGWMPKLSDDVITFKRKIEN